MLCYLAVNQLLELIPRPPPFHITHIHDKNCAISVNLMSTLFHGIKDYNIRGERTG